LTATIFNTSLTAANQYGKDKSRNDTSKQFLYITKPDFNGMLASYS
jgi:hypothetical protein